jgi:phage terminase large subunit-like protein
LFEELPETERAALNASWRFNAGFDQYEPTGDWRIWLFMGGRGSGKTRAGAEWIAQNIREQKMQRVALIGATHHEARSVMIEGESGLLSVSEGAEYQPSLRRVVWPHGAVATVLSADEADSIRGHQFDGAWLDEFAKWPEPQAALDMTLMAMRLGDDPRMLVTTTPRNIPAVLELYTNSPEVSVTTASTYDNKMNLARGFISTIEKRYKGTRLGRQEIDGQLIEDNENALWQREWIERHRIASAPDCERVVVAIDPPVSKTGDECGIVIAGRAGEEGYVLGDYSRGDMSPKQWAGRALDAFVTFKADEIVAEANQGGEMVRDVITQHMPNAPVKLVYASRDKRTRATPVASLYERGVVHHAGCFAELEDQMCQFDGTGKSPDRMDAAVWALSHLFPFTRHAEPRVRTI